MAEYGGVRSPQRCFDLTCVSACLFLRVEIVSIRIRKKNLCTCINILAVIVAAQLYHIFICKIYCCLFFHLCDFVVNEWCCFAVAAEWESGGSSGDCLLQTVCRCSLAALLKHTGLQNQACWQDRLVKQKRIFTGMPIPKQFNHS